MSDATSVIGPLQTQWRKPYRGRQDILPPAVGRPSPAADRGVSRKELMDAYAKLKAKKSGVANKQLSDIHRDSKELDGMLDPTGELPQWVQRKLAVAQMHIQDIKQYVEGELDAHDEAHRMAEDGIEDEILDIAEAGVRFSGG